MYISPLYYVTFHESYKYKIAIINHWNVQMDELFEIALKCERKEDSRTHECVCVYVCLYVYI